MGRIGRSVLALGRVAPFFFAFAASPSPAQSVVRYTQNFDPVTGNASTLYVDSDGVSHVESWNAYYSEGTSNTVVDPKSGVMQMTYSNGTHVQTSLHHADRKADGYEPCIWDCRAQLAAVTARSTLPHVAR